MGLFEKLFGKASNSKTAKAEAKERRALGLKDEAELSAEAKPAVRKAEAKPEAPKTEKKAEAKPEAPKTEKKAAPQAKKAVPKTEAKPTQSPTEAEEAEADTIAETAETVEVSDVGTGGASGRFEIKKSKDGRFVFNLYAKNHVIVATSQIYSSSTSAVNGIKSVIVNAPIAAVEDQTLKTYETQNFPKWEIYQDKGGQYRFRLSAPNGSCICHSQGYTNKTKCKNGIQSIIRSAKDASIDKSYLKKDSD